MSERRGQHVHETFGLEADLDAETERRAASGDPDTRAAEGSNHHLASIYESRSDQFETVVPFIQQGLERGERCLYVADDNTRGEVLAALREGGVDVEAARESGALAIRTKSETYERTGQFEQDAMLEFWQESLAEARNGPGFAGIRAAAEMTWAVDGGACLDQLVEYEAMLNTIYPGEDYVVLCQYSRDRFPSDVLSDVIRTHPFVVYDGTVCQNCYYDPPEAFFGADEPSLDVDRTVAGLLSRARTQRTLRERERGLAALTDVTQDLMRARPQEVCERIVETTREVLGATTAVWLYDTREDELRLTASDGPSTVDESTLADRFGDLAWERLTAGEPAMYDELPPRSSAATESTLHSGMLLPLGRHGVFLAASTSRRSFESAEVDFAKTVASTTSAALDRAERELTVQERERELEHQNEALERLNRVNAIIREIDQALVRAGTREEIERAVCERLTADDRFVFAWTGELDGDRLAVRESTGAERGYLDSVPLAVDGEREREPAVRAARSGDVTVAADVFDGVQTVSWRKRALSCGYRSVVSLPLVYEGTSYGLLTVYADRSDAFDETTRTVLTELGETIAHAINAVERTNAILTDETIELEFEVTDPGCPLLSLAREAACSLELRGVASRTTDSIRALVAVADVPVDRVVDAAEAAVGIESAAPVAEDDGDGLVRLGVSGRFIACDLADQGVPFDRVTADPTGARILVDVPATVPVKTITGIVATTYPESELVARRPRSETPARSGGRTQFSEQLTERQREVAQLAYYGGYFDQPRMRTGEDLAGTLDISPQAFHQHLRTIQRNLFSTVFGDEPP